MEGLNRDPSQALKAEQTANVNIDWKPAFSYIDNFLNGWGWPSGITGTADFLTDPKTFLNKLQDKLAQGIPLLKRPKNQQPESSNQPTSAPQTAAQH